MSYVDVLDRPRLSRNMKNPDIQICALIESKMNEIMDK